MVVQFNLQSEIFNLKSPLTLPPTREAATLTRLPPTLGLVRASYPVPKGHVPKRNYGFEKRQKELAKLQKRQLKAERRAERAADRPEDPQVQSTEAPIPPEE